MWWTLLHSIRRRLWNNSSFPGLCAKLSSQVRSIILDKIYTFQGRKEWFCRYSLVLLQELDGFYSIINKISKNERLQSQYVKELVFYYGLVIGLYRFLEGVSWGYSTLLTHKELDNDNMTSIKVLFNFMIRLKRFFFVKKINDFSDCHPSTNQAISTRQNNEIDFLCSIDHEDMENLVKGNVEPTSQYEMYTQYLDTLISDENNSILKDEIETLLEFVSEITMEEISVKSIESMQKKGRRKSNIDIQSLATEESKADEKDKPEEHVFTPLDTSKSIMAIKCSPRVSKIICKYFSNPQNDDKSAPQKGVSSKVDSKALDPLNLYIFHYCMPQNKMTYDSYYIVKNIIYSILEKCPEILSFFKLIDLDINLDLFLNSSETIRLDHTEIFIRFLKKLRELKLDYNIVICISQADLAYNKNYLCNFIFLLRHAIKHSPTYIKFILTFTSSSLIQLDEILRVLLINSGVE